jgi:Ca2+-binding RTX toxin-like protein
MAEFFGTSDADTLVGDTEEDALWGYEGDDSLEGGTNNDSLYGAEGSDTLIGGDGDDLLEPGPGDNWIDGGDGIDFLRYWDLVDAIAVDLQSGTVVGVGGTDIISSIELVTATDYADTLTGDDNANTFYGEYGDDAVDGAGGDDQLYGGYDNDSLAGGSGNDTLSGEGDDDFLYADDGDDVLDGGDGDDIASFFYAGDVQADLAAGIAFNMGGTDWLVQIEHLVGSEFGDDALAGDDGANSLRGAGGNDTLAGAGGDDSLSGGDGSADYAVFGGDFADYDFGVSGGVYVTDNVAGRDGSDWVTGVEFFQFADTTKTLAELGVTPPAIIIGTPDSDYLQGDESADTIQGGAGDDTLDGAGGDDGLMGEEGDDFLYGEEGEDTAVFSGDFADYTISYDASGGAYVLVDSVPDRDGADEVFDVEFFRFADVTKAVFELIPPPGGDEGDNYLVGTEGDDWLDGGAGNDTLDGVGGDDTLIGGEGLDVAYFTILRSGSELAVAFDGATTYANVVDPHEGSLQQLTDVERLHFSEVSVAVDIAGNAGRAALLVGVLAGEEGVANPEMMGVALAFVDAGWQDEDMMNLAADYFFAGWSDEDFSARVCENVFDQAPEADVAYLASLLQDGSFTRGSLLVGLAHSGWNSEHIDYFGLYETGIEYAPL